MGLIFSFDSCDNVSKLKGNVESAKLLVCSRQREKTQTGSLIVFLLKVFWGKNPDWIGIVVAILGAADAGSSKTRIM
jgi:hypothetical protein